MKPIHFIAVKRHRATARKHSKHFITVKRKNFTLLTHCPLPDDGGVAGTLWGGHSNTAYTRAGTISTSAQFRWKIHLDRVLFQDFPGLLNIHRGWGDGSKTAFARAASLFPIRYGSLDTAYGWLLSEPQFYASGTILV